MLKRIAVIGGDERITKLVEYLADDRFEINVYGINSSEINKRNLSINFCKDLFSAINSSDIVVGPIPFSNDDKTIFSPLFENEILIDDLINILKKFEIPLITCVIKENIKNKFIENHIKIIDLYEREELSILNAIPTVEGCIMIAIQDTQFTLHGSNILILGYGRIGKLLAKILSAFSANVFVEARKISDLTWIRAFGYTPIPLDNLINNVSNMDIIINTVPALILNKDIIDKIRKDTLIIDLASKPGGVDFEYAKKKGINAIHALSLPGKVAPHTAAKYIKVALYNVINDLGVYRWS
ncbi:dipicolinate synthase subunit DpsA [Caldicellulosiruptoraceae bacterium PP1]